MENEHLFFIGEVVAKTMIGSHAMRLQHSDIKFDDRVFFRFAPDLEESCQ